MYTSFFFHDTATTEIYTLSLHDALPIYLRTHFCRQPPEGLASQLPVSPANTLPSLSAPMPSRSEEHTSELQSQSNLVCRLLLEKKKRHNRWRPPSVAMGVLRFVPAPGVG